MSLPKIYRGDLNQITYHNTNYCYIDKIQSELEIDYKTKYYIKTINKELKTFITYKNKEYIKTLEGEKIYLNNILLLKRIS